MEEIIHPIGGLNQDAAYEANCIRKESGEYGVITNALGNEVVVVALPAGTNMVIGSCEDKEDQAVIYFLYNSNDDHCIIRYKAVSEEVEFLLEDEAVLNFSTDYKIFNPQVVGSGDEKLLFWTDNYNPPRKLNVEEAYNYEFLLEMSYVFVAAQCTIKFKLPFGKQITLDWGDGNSEIIWGEEDVLISRTSAYIVPDTYDVVLKHGLTYLTLIDINGHAGLSGDVSGLGDCTDLTYIDCSSTGVDGDVSSWSSLVNLTHLDCDLTSVSGDISGWSALVNLVSLYCGSTSVSGDISGWSALTDLIYLYCYTTSVEGDISSWATLVNLEDLVCFGTNVEGDVSGWSTMSSLRYLMGYNTSISGDISGWSTFSGFISNMWANNTDIGFASSVPSWTNNAINIDFKDCEWTATEVDNCMIALANGPVTNCTINIAGTNAARTAASDAAKVIILANGNALTVNE